MAAPPSVSRVSIGGTEAEIPATHLGGRHGPATPHEAAVATRPQERVQLERSVRRCAWRPAASARRLREASVIKPEPRRTNGSFAWWRRHGAARASSTSSNRHASRCFTARSH